MLSATAWHGRIMLLPKRWGSPTQNKSRPVPYLPGVVRRKRIGTHLRFPSRFMLPDRSASGTSPSFRSTSATRSIGWRQLSISSRPTAVVSTGRRTEGGASLADPVMQIANVNLLGGAAAVWPLAAPAQQPRVSQHPSRIKQD